MKWAWLSCCPLSGSDQGESIAMSRDPSLNAASTFAADTTVLAAKGCNSLRLVVLESTVLPTSTALSITPLGLRDCRRKDGLTYVGCDKDQADFVVEGDGELLDKRHFLLAYREGNYLLRDLGSASGTFVKVYRFFQLPAKCIIAFSDIHIEIRVFSLYVHLKVLTGEKIGQEFTFSSSLSPILIGRTATCSLVFHDSHLSRYQSSLVYQGSAGWTLFDGLNTAKPSRNGIWVYVLEDVTIWDGLIFKAGSSLFQAKLV